MLFNIILKHGLKDSGITTSSAKTILSFPENIYTVFYTIFSYIIN